MNLKKKLNDVLEIDNLSFDELTQYSHTAYKMNENPLPAIRKYFERNGILAPIHYMETAVPISSDAVYDKLCGRAVPLVVMLVVKVEGFPVNVDMRYVDINNKYPLYTNINEL